MLRKIATTDLTLGMFIHQLVGSWLDHPFWKKAFLLSDPKHLAQIRASAIREVWIDTARGLDVAAVDEEVEPIDETALQTMIMTSFAPAGFAHDEPSGAISLADELERAGRIVASARGAMQMMFRDARLGHAVDAVNCLPLVDEITQSVDRNPGAIVSLARLKTSDDYTYMHSVAVCALMIALARQLDLPEAMTREAGLAGLVHDIGKARTPTAILNKPGKLTAEEFTVVRAHPQAGYDMLKEARGVGEGPLDVCLHHHEKFDGSGYPFGLKRERLSLLARMGAVCDVYDAITSNRPYKTGWEPASSIQKMAQWSREGHFDDAVLQAFVRSVGIYPVGSLVRLASGRLAVVVDQSPANLLAPIVKTVADDDRASETIDLAQGRDRIQSRESAQALGLAGIDDYWRLPSIATT
jgi:putative nucleotidyltransferase with HDIG domain